MQHPWVIFTLFLYLCLQHCYVKLMLRGLDREENKEIYTYIYVYTYTFTLIYIHTDIDNRIKKIQL